MLPVRTTRLSSAFRNEVPSPAYHTHTRVLHLLPICFAEHDFVDPHTPTVKHIAGQAVYQLAVMYGLIFYAPALLGIPGGTPELRCLLELGGRCASWR